MPAVLGSAIGIGKLASYAGGVGSFFSKFGGPLLNAVGGLFGGQGGDKSNLTRHYLSRLVRDAREAGVHPLYALGASPGYGPTFQTGSASGDALRAGANLFSDIRAESQAKAAAGVNDRLANAQIRSLEASALRDETAAQVQLAEAALNAQSMSAQNRDLISARLDEEMLYRPETFGRKIPDALIPVRLANGKVLMIPDQNLLETGEIIGNTLTAQPHATSWWDDFKKMWRPFGSKRKKPAPSDNGWEKAGVIHRIQR